MWKRVAFFVLFPFISFGYSYITAPPDTTNCGYQSCHRLKEGFVNVHLVPHSHNDVGWLKTVDQYYWGSNQSIQNAGVQYILDSVIEALRKNNERRFIYVETAFLWRWWMKQHDFVKHNVKKFINNGQLEIIGGGWCMNDEAVTHYQSTIDQLTWGLRKLNETFGKCGKPKIGWQIDPFGHSREMASLFAQMGYEGLLLGRIDYQDKKFKFDTKTAEFVWRGSDSLGNRSDIFTSVMYNTYSPPAGFCFDILCTDEPIIDDKKSPDYNVDRRIDDFFKYLDNVTKAYATDNVIITMGQDFNYQDANIWFKNMDKLIQYANERQKNGSKYHLLYSTPSCYLKAVKDEAVKRNIKFPLKTDDFFPYASDANSYWTGYFTSRPTLKRYERVGNNYLQICKQLYALVDLGPEDWVDLNYMREAMGVMQHHDAITGTEKQHVSNDYARLLAKGFEECEFITATALSQLVTGHGTNRKLTDETPAPEIPFQSCLLSNISQCEFAENQNDFVATVYNPLSRHVDYYVRLPVTGKSYKVVDSNGNAVDGDLVPISQTVINIPGRFSQAKVELVFRAENIPPLGFKSYYISKVSNGAINVIKQKNYAKSNESLSFKLNNVQAIIDPSTGKITNLTMNNKHIPFSQDFLYYKGTVGDNKIAENRSSGAYIFRPNGTEAIQISPNASYKVYEGKVVAELHQIFNDWTSQIIRVYRDENYLELDWVVGPIPTDDVNGKEIITRYVTNLKTDNTFYTDSNGRSPVKRVRNFRPTWKLELSEPVSGNYYPVTTKLSMRDERDDVEVSVIVDRAQGGASLQDGELELMLHRNCLHDDAFGVEEALNEEAYGKGLVARGSHYVMVGPYLNKTGNSIAAQEHDVIQRKILSAWTFVSPTNGLSFAQYKAKYKMEFSGLKNPLPANVQILTLEPWKGMSFLLRLEHIFDVNEHSQLSKPAKIDLKGLFSPFVIEWYNETKLGGNEWSTYDADDNVEIGDSFETILKNKIADDIKTYNDAQESLKWSYLAVKYRHDQTATNDIRKAQYVHHNEFVEGDEDFMVTLNPMEIRTFVIEIKMI